MEAIDYTNLTELLIKVIKDRSALFIKEAKISNLSIFITGYYACNSKDLYFDDSTGFVAWFLKKESPKKMSMWQDYFLAKVQSDEHEALVLYFKYLEEYYSTYYIHNTSKNSG